MATTNYSWNLPTVGGSEDTWGTSLNANWTALDTLLGGTNATEFAILDGATVSTTELNKLDGVTASTTEINTLDGVTSSIQTQLDAKAPLASPTLTGTTTVSRIEVDDGNTDSVSDLAIRFAVDTDTGFYRSGTNGLGIVTAGVERLRFNASGAFGINGTSYGSAGQVMTSNGSAAAPTWGSVEGVGQGQTWQGVSRTPGVTYQNTTGKPIAVSSTHNVQGTYTIQVSTNGSSWVTLSRSTENDFGNPFFGIVPNTHYYRVGAFVYEISELR